MTVSNINNSLFTDLSALDGQTLSTLTAVNGQTIVSTPPPSVPFINSFTAGTLRSNAGFPLGFRFTVGSSAMTVTSLGRWRVSGNTGMHVVQIVDTSSPNGHVAQATLDMSSGTVNAFKFAAITPVVLTANHDYFVVSEESNGGDQWSDDNATVGTTADGTITTSEYEPGGINSGVWQSNTAGVKSYVAPNFEYYI